MESNLEFSKCDFEDDRYNRLKLIPWWNQERLSSATIMVVGAGAIGNELVKNLALLGIGKIIIVDMDRIEHSNLTRAVLFRQEDVGRYKAQVAAEKAVELNPDIKAVAITSNVINDVGLGLFKSVDMVLGGLDNREARLFINQSCYKVNKVWIDGAIEALNGIARVFKPNQGACYECTMSETDWNLINKRKSCSLLTNEEMAEGKIPTTPTSSSIISGIQIQEMLKLLHIDRGLPTLIGKGYVFNGLTHDSYLVEYQEKEDCMSHEILGEIVEKDWSVKSITLRELLTSIRSEIGCEAVIDFDREIVTTATCICGKVKKIYMPINKIKAEMIFCENCQKQMNFEHTHSITGKEDFLDKTPYEIGLPLFHIVSGRIGMYSTYYEFHRDKKEVLSLFEEE